jgi:superfamily I DNA/RNA helicase
MVNHDRLEHQLSPEILAFAPLIERTHITNTNYRLSKQFVAWARMRSAYIQKIFRFMAMLGNFEGQAKDWSWQRSEENLEAVQKFWHNVAFEELRTIVE